VRNVLVQEAEACSPNHDVEQGQLRTPGRNIESGAPCRKHHQSPEKHVLDLHCCLTHCLAAQMLPMLFQLPSRLLQRGTLENRQVAAGLPGRLLLR